MSTVTTQAEQKLAVLYAVDKLIEFMNERTAEVWTIPSLEPYTFELEGGRKYLKISMGSGGCGKSVHCFVDSLSGDVYKAASWKAPALNGARFNILDEESLARLKARFDHFGSYLYK